MLFLGGHATAKTFFGVSVACYPKWTPAKENPETTVGKEIKCNVGKEILRAHVTQKTLRAALNFAQTENPKITQSKCWNYFKTTVTSAQCLVGEHGPLKPQ